MSEEDSDPSIGPGGYRHADIGTELARSAEEVERKALGNSPMSQQNRIEPPSGQPMHSQDRWLFLVLGWMAIPAGIFVAGFVALYSGAPHWGGAGILIGLLGMSAASFYLLENRPRAPHPGGFLICLAILTWLFVGSQTWLAFHQPMQGYTQTQLDNAVQDAKTEAVTEFKKTMPLGPVIHDPPSAEDIAKATAPIQSQLDAAQKTIVDLRNTISNLGPRTRTITVPTPIIGSPLGPLTTLQMRQILANNDRRGGPTGGSASPSPVDLRWALAITAPQANQEIADFLYRLMIEAGLRVQRLQIPDHSINLDAPDFPQGGPASITLHGTNVLNERLLGILQNCLTVRTTSKVIDGLFEWYRTRTAPEQNVVWIEIGNGSPWRQGPGCEK
jgi:hypothetical protein